MGYTTEFEGSFALSKPLAPHHKAYLDKFAETRRVTRDAAKAEALPDPVRDAVGLPIGPEGAYFVGAGGFHGQDRDASVDDYNNEPEGQPGLWCKWQPNKAGTAIEWNGAEKFYDYVEWLQYIVDHFLKPWGYALNGEVTWDGEERDDVGKIVAVSNVITVKKRIPSKRWADATTGGR